MNSATQVELDQLIAMQQQVSHLAVRRKHIRSALVGQHQSRLRGRGMELDEVRVYQPGDDVASIDWKVTARKGVTHTKLFHEERERPVLICMDYRQSMFFATQGALKSVIATKVAALLAWHGVAHGDRLGGLLFSDFEHFEIKPGRGRRGVLSFLHHCVEATKRSVRETHNPQSFEDMTHRLRRVSRHGSLIYVLSDFRGMTEVAEANLSQLSRHNDVVLISVTDSLEKGELHQGVYPVFDGNKHFSFAVNKDFQKQYAALYQQRVDMLNRLHLQHGMQHISISTIDDIDTVIRDRLWAL